ncbi:hypothetical protein ABZP36_017476 [Zizania latifolia]
MVLPPSVLGTGDEASGPAVAMGDTTIPSTKDAMGAAMVSASVSADEDTTAAQAMALGMEALVPLMVVAMTVTAVNDS